MSIINPDKLQTVWRVNIMCQTKVANPDVEACEQYQCDHQGVQ